VAAENYDSKKKSSHEDLLAAARKRFLLAEEAEREMRSLGLDDLKFRAGEQWPQSVKSERDMDARPCLTINRIPQFIRQVTNDQRQNRPSIKVHPVDDQADVETAKIYQGLIRHIEYNSDAETAFDTAFEGAATMGFGYFRVITDYVSPTSFEQEILIKRIRNHFSVYFDPSSKEIDGSDASWAFVVEDMPLEDFKAEYGSSELAGLDDWASIGNARAEGWLTDSTVRVAEYFHKEFKEVTICLLEGGKSIEKEELEKIYPEGLPEGLVLSERKSKVPVIKWCKINGVEVLEETEWPGRWIPIIPVYGDELDIEGKRVVEGVIRHAKDSQRMYNYWVSTETEAIALAPKAPFIVAEGQIPREHEAMWRSANRKSYAFLQYKPVSFNGQMAPPPQRNFTDTPIQSITTARMHAAEDLKATTGIYDSALGAQSNETSGVAIQRRNQQAQTSNFHLIDNLTRSIRHCGRILVDLIPKIYDTARTARIIGEEGDQEVVRINQEFEKDGKALMYDLGVGKYDVVVDTGPSFATRRVEAAISMESMARSYPQLVQVAGDLMIKNMDWPGAQEIAERFKKIIPPDVLGEEEAQEIPPQVQAQMQQMNQMIEAMTTQLQEATKTIEQKTIEIESKERIEFAKMETDLEKEKLKQFQGLVIQDINEQIADLRDRMMALGLYAPIGEQFNGPQAGIPGEHSMGQDPMQSPEALPDGAQLGPQGFYEGLPQSPEPTGGYIPGQPPMRGQ
jgi:hypothetical protein